MTAEADTEDNIAELLLPPANEVCEGNVFTGVCLSGGGMSAPLHAGIHLPWTRGRHPSPWADTPSACWDTVNKRAVRIPLEFILVAGWFESA